MSKTIINIKSITVNVSAGAAASSGINPSLIGMLIHRAISEAAEGTEGETGTGDTAAQPNASADQQDAAWLSKASEAVSGGYAPQEQVDQHVAAFASPAPLLVLNHDNVLHILRADPRYTKRTLEAVAKAFPEEIAEVVESVLLQMVADGKVKQLTRRSDGEFLYQALVEAQVVDLPGESPVTAEAAPATETAEPIELSAENLVAFLNSDHRYTKRTEAAIVKHFAGHSAQSVRDLIDDLVDVDIDTKTRRSDGATLYYAL